jgi:peptidoglycan/LPS O-acetylase OafA/YrhL
MIVPRCFVGGDGDRSLFHVGFIGAENGFVGNPWFNPSAGRARLAQRASALLNAPRSVAALLMFMTATLVVFTPSYFNANQFQFYAVVGALLPALFSFTNRATWDRWLGELSFPLYLVHWPVLAFSATAVRHWLPQSIGTNPMPPLLAVAVSIAMAILIDRTIVEPSDRWRHLRAAQLQSPSRNLLKAAQVDPRAVAAGQ